MNISSSQDGFFLPSPPPSSINGGLVQIQENYPIPNPNPNPNLNNQAGNNKRKRNLPGNPDPEAEVVAMSPKSLMMTNRFICEICNKGFQRDQNLQLHRRGHNLPWKLKQKPKDQVVKRKVYICPEKSCVHHDPSRALGDLTGIKKHFSRKHGEKKWKCDKCSKKYAVMSDWKAHSKICGTREYKCDCGTIFSRKDSFITHRAFCDALTEERIRVATDVTGSALNSTLRPDLIGSSMMANHQTSSTSNPSFLASSQRSGFLGFDASSINNTNNNLMNKPRLPLWLDHNQGMNNQMNLASSSLGGVGHGLSEFSSPNLNIFGSSSSSMQQGSILPKEEMENMGSYQNQGLISLYSFPSSSSIGNMSATALLQKAAQIGSTQTDNNSSIFATALGVMRSSSSSSSTSSKISENMNNMNNNDFFRQKQIFRQQMNDQLAGLQAYSTRSDHQLPMMGNIHHGDSYNFEGSRSTQGSTNVSMRDFLGTLGGGEGNNDGREQEGEVLLQDEMAYKLATMAGSQDHQHQEPYMDLMR